MIVLFSIFDKINEMKLNGVGFMIGEKFSKYRIRINQTKLLL